MINCTPEPYFQGHLPALLGIYQLNKRKEEHMSNHENQAVVKAPLDWSFVVSPERSKKPVRNLMMEKSPSAELERVENEEIIIEKEKKLGLSPTVNSKCWHLDFRKLDGVELVVKRLHFSVQFKDKDVKPKTHVRVGWSGARKRTKTRCA